MKLKPIDEQVAVVFGAASGIGRETALQFAQRGANVLVADNDEVGLQTLVEEIRGVGGAVALAVADAADFQQVQAVADRAREHFGGLDTWVHCAAVALYATFQQTTPEEFQRVVNVNLMGQVYGAKAALPHLLQRGGGALIHISSIEAKRALPYHSAYASAKHGIDGLIEAMRLELRQEGLPISVTQVMPASINTPLFDKARTKIGVKPKGLPPFYEPSTVASAILYAAEHPVRDIVVGGAGKALVLGQRLSPRLLDAIFLRVGFSAQKTVEPKPEAAPNNLFGPVAAYNRVEGDFGNQSFSHSFATWLDLHPIAKTAATVGAAFGIGAMLARGNGNAENVRSVLSGLQEKVTAGR
jgi:NAD(P)-dependent dehydrogenase (short-subunit alcohol dehydrogenase family)